MVSDVHLGNPRYRPQRPFVDFLRYAYEHACPVCINGDGVDILQSSIVRLARDLVGCNREFARFAARGLPIYYTVGNHDMALEQFLEDWGVIRVVPFLNLLSGDRRIRIEHGHLYDEMFVRYPRIYAGMTMLGAVTLRVSPAAFRLFHDLNRPVIALGEWRHGSHKGTDEASALARKISGERAAFIRAAIEIAERGFDAVIFGHTHRQGYIELPSGAGYYNTGFWNNDPYFAEVTRGEIVLKAVSEIR